jgi:hypothetical protein
MDQKYYHDILVRHAVPAGTKLIGPNFIFQEDNDPKHSAKLNRNFLDTKEKAGVLRRMIWPPQSPVLNPIEQIWDLLDSKLNKNENI